MIKPMKESKKALRKKLLTTPVISDSVRNKLLHRMEAYSDSKCFLVLKSLNKWEAMLVENIANSKEKDRKSLMKKVKTLYESTYNKMLKQSTILKTTAWILKTSKTKTNARKKRDIK